MDYGQVEALALQVGAAAEELSGGGAGLGATPEIGVAMPLPFGHGPVFATAPAFGNTDSAGDCLSEFHRLHALAGSTLSGLTQVLDEDVVRLGEAVATFRQMDHAAADRMFAASGQSMSLYSAHVHSDGSNDDDLVRAGQIERLRESIDGPAILGADLNTELDNDNQSAAAVAAYGDHGFEVEAGEVGGTSHSGRSIDYVMPTDGVSVENPTRVDGGPSDHDGQRVDVTIPRW
ncbi:hypothetical protein ABNF97_06820 [Plantactinospora sp. B6F1]|uniref:hypothetical protein n=1 Tax=Plantactinospora sp. B6F1 TaxID=3158971 RepID=UPI0032D8DF38